MACYKNRKKQQRKINKIIREINKILNQEKLLAVDLTFLISLLIDTIEEQNVYGSE